MTDDTRRDSSRLLAARVLSDMEERKGLVDELVDGASTSRGLEARERRALTRIVFEVTRRRRLLDSVTTAYGGRKPEDLKTGLRQALRVGTFEILYSRGVPPYAAVSEAVDAAKRLAGVGASRLCNAVLRKILRGMKRIEGEGGGRKSGAMFLPTGPGRGVLFDRPVFPPPRDTAAHLAAVHSMPRWLVTRWLAVHGIEGTERLLVQSNCVPPIQIRIRGGAPPPGIETRSTREEGVFELVERTDPASLDAFRAGEITVQDVTSAAPVKALDPKPGQRVLDLCAAPGGKAVQSLDRMKGLGLVVALDRDRGRLTSLIAARDRMGARGVKAVCGDGRRPPFREATFDRVIVDAPCSNTGVLRRRPEVRWRLHPRLFAELSALQAALLTGGSKTMKPDGALVYSTCSIDPVENSGVVGSFLSSSGFRLAAEETVLPGAGDGGFWALLSKDGNAAPSRERANE
jgi:16S rRNA (cytosine967-C5)-methyltransferase